MIKMLLGVYGDEINAQNINGLEIAKRLDKNKFEVHMLYYNNKPEIDGVIFHKTSNNKIVKNIRKMMLFIKSKFDIYYLPRIEKTDIIFAKLLSKKKCIISSIEIENALHNDKYKEFFCNYIFDFFSINKGLQDSTEKEWNKKTELLYLGYCKNDAKPIVKKKIKTICFVGSLIERKKPLYILELAKQYPEINFKVIGDGPLRKKIDETINEKCLKNVQMIGKIENIYVYEELNKSELLVITSENEGQPKVSLEAASLGVPTCYIKKNYSIDYIKNMETGFEVESIEDIINLIKFINSDNKLLEKVSENVIREVEKYDWDLLIKDYEKYFCDVVEKWNERG